jgi:hypothetical protein
MLVIYRRRRQNRGQELRRQRFLLLTFTGRPSRTINCTEHLARRGFRHWQM